MGSTKRLIVRAFHSSMHYIAARNYLKVACIFILGAAILIHIYEIEKNSRPLFHYPDNFISRYFHLAYCTHRQWLHSKISMFSHLQFKTQSGESIGAVCQTDTYSF